MYRKDVERKWIKRLLKEWLLGMKILIWCEESKNLPTVPSTADNQISDVTRRDVKSADLDVENAPNVSDSQNEKMEDPFPENEGS